MTTLPSQAESRLCIEAASVETLVLPLDTQENEDQLILALLSSVTPKLDCTRNILRRPPLDSGSVSSAMIHHPCFLISASLFQNYCCSCPLPHASHQFLGCKQSCLVFGVYEFCVDLVLHDPACRLLGEELASFSFPCSWDPVLGQGGPFSHV